MSFLDTLKESLGFENVEKARRANVPNSNNQPRGPMTPSYDNYEFSDDFYDNSFSVSPEQSFYEFILIKPKTREDLDYVCDQVIEGNNPVIMDISFYASSIENGFHEVGEKLKVLRKENDAEVILLEKSSSKILILISPKRVKLIKKF